jgi:hypothetical protein
MRKKDEEMSKCPQQLMETTVCTCVMSVERLPVAEGDDGDT